MVVKYIKGGFGKTQAFVSAFVYTDKKAFDTSESIKKKPKKKVEAGAEAPAKKKWFLWQTNLQQNQKENQKTEVLFTKAEK